MSLTSKISSFISKASSKQGLLPSVRGIFTSQDKTKISQGKNLFGDSQRELFTASPNVTVDTLYDVVKRSGEVVGVISVIMTDLVADGWMFKPMSSNSKSAIKKAEDAEQRLNYYKVLGDAIFDLLITGDGFILKSSVSEKDILNSIANKLDNTIIKSGTKEHKSMVKEVMKTVEPGTKKLQVLKSSTVSVGEHDIHGNIKTWKQKVGEIVQIYDANDVIHLTTTNIGGSIFGFTPLQAIIDDVATLIFAKNMVSKAFENQGVPPNIWNLPDANSEDDRTYQTLKKALIDLKKQKNKLRDILTIGNLQNLQTKDNMLQDSGTQELMTKFTNIILFAFGVPAHRVPFIQAKTTVFPKESNDGYYKTLQRMQKCLEPTLNAGLWNEFGVNMKFNNSYRVDEQREAVIASTYMDRGAMTIEEARDKINLPRELPKNETMPIDLKRGENSGVKPENMDSKTNPKVREDSEAPKELQDNKMKSLGGQNGK